MWSFNTKWSDFPTTSGVYAIVNTLNGKKYVGSTKCFKERFAEHRSQLRKGNHKNVHLQNSYNNYGEKYFKFMVLEECEKIQDTLNFVENQEVIRIASQLLLVAAIFQISDGIQVVMLGALRGLQDVKIPMYIAFLSYWVIGFPISIYFGLYTELKAVGIWIGLFAGLTSAAIFLYLRFNYLTKKLITQNA